MRHLARRPALHPLSRPGLLHRRGYFERSDQAARQLVAAEKLVEKAPVLLHNPDPAKWFGTPEDATYEVLLAQSVFTHLDVPHIEACFGRLGSIMTPGARFFFTFKESPASQRRNLKDYFILSGCSARWPGAWIRHRKAGGLRSSNRAGDGGCDAAVLTKLRRDDPSAVDDARSLN